MCLPPTLNVTNHALQIENLLEFYVVGVSLGTAWAHPSTGDTVASVMIGGLRTVQNGAFPIHTNDLICIYFDDERDLFEVGSCVCLCLRACVRVRVCACVCVYPRGTVRLDPAVNVYHG